MRGTTRTRWLLSVITLATAATVATVMTLPAEAEDRNLPDCPGQSLLHSDSDIRDNAWAEVLDPIAERVDRQEIMVYTHDDNLRPEMNARFKGAGLETVIEYGDNHPVWSDTVPWEEPPPAAEGNYDSWQTALDKGPRRMATDWPKEMTAWLEGKCE